MQSKKFKLKKKFAKLILVSYEQGMMTCRDLQKTDFVGLWRADHGVDCLNQVNQLV